jgi:HEAT repeat protein
MKVFSVALLAVVVSGCARAEPTLSGGKPVDHWIKALTEPDAKVRKTAAFKLGNAGPVDAAVFPALVAGLKDSDPAVRCEVILALLKFGPVAKEAIPALTDLRQQDEEPKVRDYAAKALVKIEGKYLSAPHR